MSKICGLLPVKFTENRSGKIEGHVSTLQILYGMLVLLMYIGLQCWGLYRDLHNGWQNSIRLSTESAVTITCSDVLAVMIVIVVAIIGSPFQCRSITAALNKIVYVDEKLNFATSKNLRRQTIIVVSCTFLYLMVLSVLDYVSWSISSDTKNVYVFSDKGPINYCPLYFMYVVIMTFQIQYAFTLFNVGERFLKINSIIMNYTNNNFAIKQFWKDMELDIPYLRKDLTQAISFISSNVGHSRFRRTNTITDFIITGEGTEIESNAIDQLITLYGILCDSIVHINNAYGSSILSGTISCLIHLTITPYFLYNEIYRDNNSSYYVLMIKILWVFFHIYRLLLFVQPCYMITTKVKTMGILVSQALVNNSNPEVKKQLEIFSIQLLQRPVEFTVCGLFYLNRGLVTSIVGSVTTYLVILLQFQKANDTEVTKILPINTTELLKNVSTIQNISEIKMH